MIERVGKNQGHSCLPERSSLLCGLATSTLDAVCDSINSGNITVRDLDCISGKWDQMEKLCSAAKTGNLEKKGKEYSKIKRALETRLNEYEAFVNRKELLGKLGNGVTVRVTGKHKLNIM